MSADRERYWPLTLDDSFQERCLSRRYLFIFDSDVISKCCRSVWREHVKLEDRSVNFCVDMGGLVTIGGYSSAIGHTYESKISELEDWAHDNFASCLCRYARRILTYDSDMLDASAGISRCPCEKIGELVGKTSYELYVLPTFTLHWAVL